VNWLVDTDVFSESAKPEPDPRVVAWLKANEADLYISTVTIGELRRGIERLPAGRKKSQLRAWLLRVCDCMKGRVLSYNTSTAHVWGQLKADWDRKGITVPSLDGVIAATAQRHGLTVVTRNAAHFQRTGVKLLNPFE
jgi:toxin FitB